MTDAALLRKILHTLGRPTQAELDAGLAAIQRMERNVDADLFQRQSAQLAEAREFCGIGMHKLTRAEGLLKKLSSRAWVPDAADPAYNDAACLFCGAGESLGHRPTCTLAIALKDAP